jgi:hypothetical protein
MHHAQVDVSQVDVEIEDGRSVLGSIFRQLHHAAVLHEYCEIIIGVVFLRTARHTLHSTRHTVLPGPLKLTAARGCVPRMVYLEALFSSRPLLASRAARHLRIDHAPCGSRLQERQNEKKDLQVYA